MPLIQKTTRGKKMNKKVKLLVILFFITVTLSVCTAIGVLITMIMVTFGTIGILPVKICMITNVVLVALVIIQAYHLLKLPTIN